MLGWVGLPWWLDSRSLPAIQMPQIWSLGQEDSLEKKMSTHSSILAWEIPWTEEHGGLQSMRSQRVRHSQVTKTRLRLEPYLGDRRREGPEEASAAMWFESSKTGVSGPCCAQVSDQCPTVQGHQQVRASKLMLQIHFGSFFSFFFFFFLAVLGLHCCAWASSSCGRGVYSLLWCTGFSWGWLLLLQSMGSRALRIQ